MRYLVLAIALLTACEEGEQDSPAVAARKVDCKQLEAHIFRISPQSAPQFSGLSESDAQQLADRMAAKLPPEDIDQCAAGEPEITSCMKTAGDVAAIKACIPPDGVIDCLQKAKQDRDARQVCMAAIPCVQASKTDSERKACVKKRV